MPGSAISPDLLRGHTDTMVLRLLLDGDQYGYQITRLIHLKSGGRYDLKEATMYSSLKRLESEGCILSYWGDESQGVRRRYYRITQKGRQAYAENKRNWEQAREILGRLL